MTLSTLRRLRALPAIALALALAAALAGCSSSEPAEEPAAPAPADQPATPEAPAEEAEEPEPEPEFDTQAAEPIAKDQLVASTAYYSEGYEEANTQLFEYDDAGRLVGTKFSDSDFGNTWTYDENGNLLTQVETYMDENGAPLTNTITFKYNAENLPVERTFETTQPPTYYDPETGEQVDDPSQGVLQEWDAPKRTYEWSERGALEKTTEYNAAGEATIYESTYQLPLITPVNTVSIDPLSAGGIGYIEDNLRMLSDKVLDAEGFLMSETSNQYNSAGDPVSSSTKRGEMSVTETWTYDEHGNETSHVVDYGGGETYTTDTEWVYGESGEAIEKVVTDPDFGTQYFFLTYDSKGRLKTRTDATPFEGEYYFGCTVYDYLVDNEEPASTPEQLMAEARAKVQGA